MRLAKDRTRMQNDRMRVEVDVFWKLPFSKDFFRRVPFQCIAYMKAANESMAMKKVQAWRAGRVRGRATIQESM
jgi:hypothetical protein